MKHTCWECRNLISEVGTPPPVFCKAYPDGDGISISILSGQYPHDHLFGDEKEKVFFEWKKKEI